MNRIILAGCVMASLFLPSTACKRSENGSPGACAERSKAFLEWGDKLLTSGVERPRSALDAEIDDMLKLPDRDARLAGLLERVFGDCLGPLMANLGALKTARAADKPRILVEGISRALSNCDCKVDEDAARAYLYASLRQNDFPVSATPSQASPCDAGNRLIDSTDGMKICTEECGDRSAPEVLVLVNGGPGMSHEMLRGFCRFATGKRRAIMYDWRGNGGSTVPFDGQASMEAHITDIGAVIRSTGAAKVDLLGHSAGGILAMAYAQRHPERLKSLVLVSPGAASPAGIDMVHQNIMQRIAEAQKKGLLPTPLPLDIKNTQPEFQQAVMKIYCPGLPAGIPKEMLETRFSPAGPFWDEFRRYELHKRLSGLLVKTILIHGADDPGGQELVSDIQQALAPAQPEVHIIKSCGHFPWLEQPAEFDRLLTGWLER